MSASANEQIILEHWDPKVYSNSSDLRVQHAFDVLAKCGYQFKGNERVLDIGCGDGKITAEIAKLIPNGQVLGIDLSHDMIAHAKKTHVRNNLAFAVENAIEISHTDTFDLVVSFACLHWVPNQILALKKIKHSLKSKGNAILMLYTNNDGTLHAINAVIKAQKWASYFKDFINPCLQYDKTTYEKLMSQTDFNLIKMDEEALYLSNTQEEFEAVTRGWSPHLTALPPQQYDEFLHDVSDYIKLNHTSTKCGDKFPAEAIRLIVHAVKG